jgi:crotonobetainyl-CoA:carnitine CoA-transferase CaiB-like acyl-CoA transferase
MKHALAGVRILDFTRVLAGPFCTMLLADLGAEVIKIESPQGDDTRQWGPPWHTADGERHAAYYLSVNRNKRSVVLNLRHPQAQAVARQLAERSQILVENFKPGGMASFGLDYDSLRQLNPSLVYGSITGYGQTGPYRDRPGYDFVIQGQSGLMSITGEADGAPHKVGVAVSDVFAGLFAASSLLAALRHAERTGEGQHVDIALLDSQIAALVNIASGALVSGRAPARYGNAHPSIVPYQAFAASDGDFTLAVGNNRQFTQLCALIERPEWATDERFSTNAARVANREVLIALLSEIFARRPQAEWVRDLLALGIPAGEINTVTEILDDPHIQARGLIQTLPMGDHLLRMVGHPVQYSATPAQAHSAPPTLGQHTDEVLRERLGLRDEEIAGLRESGAIG